MNNSFILKFEEGMPKGTAQQKGVAIRYKNGRPYVQHYKKDKVDSARKEFIFKLKPYAPKTPIERPVKLFVWLCFDVKDRHLWGKYKTTRPDADGYVKEYMDALGECGFFKDDSFVVDLRVVRTYAEKASFWTQIEELGDKPDLMKGD